MISVRDGDLDSQSPSQALHPPTTTKLVPHLEIQTDQQKDGPSLLSGQKNEAARVSVHHQPDVKGYKKSDTSECY